MRVKNAGCGNRAQQPQVDETDSGEDGGREGGLMRSVNTPHRPRVEGRGAVERDGSTRQDSSQAQVDRGQPDDPAEEPFVVAKAVK